MTAISATCRRASVAFSLALSLIGCGGGGGSSSVPADPPPTNTVLTTTEDAPGVQVAIVSLAGASGSDGSYRVGDLVTARFTLTQRDGSPWGLPEMSRASAMISGPTFDYTRVIAEQLDVATAAVKLSDGSFQYTFPPLPATYLAPLNDSPSFGALDGELTGQALFAGTYTLGLSFVWSYTVEGRPFVDAGEITADFRLGGGSLLTPREVVKAEQCNRCHVTLQAHGGERRDLTLCLLCHTSGAEDQNDPALAGGTPDVSIDFRVLMHKVHNGRHLPSVVGVGVDTTGHIDYTVAPKPYLVADAATGVRDFSKLGFPAWPSRTIPMPRDQGYASIGAAAQAKDDLVRTGLTDCATCHGDPDGAGPLTAPAQQQLINAAPTRYACGSCHDDVDWTREYKVNENYVGTMPAQDDNAGCIFCHDPAFPNNVLSTSFSHIHPLKDPADILGFGNHGVAIGLTSAVESGVNNGDGTLDPGEKLSLTFTLQDEQGTEIAPSSLTAIHAVVSGPSNNANLVVSSAIPTAMLAGPQPFTIDLPERIGLEFVGDATGALGDVFATARSPHHDVAGALTEVAVRTAFGATTNLASAAAAPQNFIDVDDTTGFARDDFLVIDDGVAPKEEYLRIQFVDGERLWFSSPQTPSYPSGLTHNHAAGAQVRRVQLASKVKGVDFALDPANGVITELTEFGAGNAVVVSYTSDFLLPRTYPVALNDSPDLDETWGEWSGKDLVSGTYHVELTGYVDLVFQSVGENNPYRAVSNPAGLDILVGSASVPEPYSLISSGDNCYACHQDMYFHDGKYRGFDTCIACHGTAGSEDRPRYVAANAPATTGVTVNFRTLLHQIHMGSKLVHASTFTTVSDGPAPYPDNFTLRTFDHVLFPAESGGAAQCAKCHGATNDAWKTAALRDHPTQQGLPVREWRAVCATCHDSTGTQAHIATQTSGAGEEACTVCHDPGNLLSVETVHKTR